MRLKLLNDGLWRSVCVCAAGVFGICGTAIIFYNVFGDLNSSCRDATEIAVSAHGVIYCSIPMIGVVRMSSVTGKHISDIPIPASEGGFTMRLKDNELQVYIFRGDVVRNYSVDGKLTAEVGDAASKLAMRSLVAYPHVRESTGNVEYELHGGQVYETKGGVRRLVVASNTPEFIPRGMWIASLYFMAAGVALFWSQRRASERNMLMQ